MKDYPISPTQKVRDLRQEPRTPLEKIILPLAQIQQGGKVMPDVVRGLWGQVTGAPMTEPPRPFRKGSPPPAPSEAWQRRVAIAAARERARLAERGQLGL